MKPALVLLNPRAIPEVQHALEGLPIPVIRLVAMTEQRITERWGDVLNAARQRNYTHLTVISDDAIIQPRALAAILSHLHLPVVTGYSNLDMEDVRVNLCDRPLEERTPSPKTYSMPTVWDVLEGPVLRPTYFTGMALTTMSLELWQRFPFEVYDAHRGGCASDYSLSLRLQDNGIPIVAHRDAYVRHLKEKWLLADKDPKMEILVGKIPEEIILP